MHALAITEQGLEVHVDGETLLLRRGREVARRVRLTEVNEVVLFGRVEITAAAVAVLVRRGIDVVYLTTQGYFRARLAGRQSRAAALRQAQLRRTLDPVFCAAVARALVAGKIAHQRQLLLRAQRRLADADLAAVLARLRLLAEACRDETDLDRLRGREGQAAALYFSQFGKLLRVSELAFVGRSRRPPRDPVNACLSFGYTLLGTVAETEVLRCGLDPGLGFFHQPHPGRPSLALDLVEEFRPLVDGLVLRLINRRQLGPLDFERTGGPALEEILAETPESAEPAAGEPVEGIYLTGPGRKVFLTEFFRRLRERLYYPPRQGSFALRDILREQAYHLARVVEGQDPAYLPFVPA